MDRKLLISLSIKYQGDYSKIIKAVNNKENIDYIECDNAITIFDDCYPRELFELKCPPFVLFYKGNKELLKHTKKIGVVGSRKPSNYALKATKDLVMSKNDYVIVSGLAKGIDGQAHKFASKTIGVLGCGIDYIYPYENKNLIEKMSKDQLVISEYPGNVKPIGYHFPFRNRIISALSECLYVMELKEKSGTMTSINEALELGKQIKVLPFDIYLGKDVFNNNLILEGSEIIDMKEIFV